MWAKYRDCDVKTTQKFKCTLYLNSEIHAQFLIQTEGKQLQEKGMDWRSISTLTFEGAQQIVLSPNRIHRRACLEHDKESSYSTQGSKFLDQLRAYKFLKRSVLHDI
jgi:hypothetical protein